MLLETTATGVFVGSEMHWMNALDKYIEWQNTSLRLYCFYLPFPIGLFFWETKSEPPHISSIDKNVTRTRYSPWIGSFT